MKFFYLLCVLSSLFLSCGNPSAEKPEVVEKSEESKTISAPKSKDEARVSGSFQITVDGKKYQSTQLQDNYCDMSFNYAGEKSFVVIRFKDVNTNDIVLLTLYGDEDYITNPIGKVEHFMLTSQQNPKAALMFMAGDNDQGSLGSIGMAEGTLIISEFEKGKIVATFSGSGGKAVDVMKNENLVPYEGSILLVTKNITVLGKNE